MYDLVQFVIYMLHIYGNTLINGEVQNHQRLLVVIPTTTTTIYHTKEEKKKNI